MNNKKNNNNNTISNNNNLESADNDFEFVDKVIDLISITLPNKGPKKELKKRSGSWVL